MGREVKRLLSLYKNNYISELQLFNRLVEIVADGTVEVVMPSIPSEYLGRFRDWIDRLFPALDTLINIKTGPLSEHEKATVRAIREWLEHHAGEDRANVPEAGLSWNGPGDADRSHPVGHPG